MTKRVFQIITIAVFLISMSACGEAEPAPTPVPPTETPTPLPPTETPTPLPPTETPLPSPTPEGFPGWKKFEGGGIELWLPEDFEGGDLSKDLDLILETIGEISTEFEEYMEIVAQNKEMFVLYAIDIDLSDLTFVTNVNVTHFETLSAVQIGDVLEASLSQLPEFMVVTDAEILTVAGYDASKLVLQYPLEGVEIAQAIFTIKDGGGFWTVAYTTSGSKFAEMLPIFEQSISTFKIVE